MKLWLLEILACPIDKAYPLSLDIFEWAKHDTLTFEKIIEDFSNKKLSNTIDDKPIVQIDDTEGLLIRDDLVIKPTLVAEYLSILLLKIEELKFVKDLSKTAGSEALSIIMNTIKPALENFKNHMGDNIDSIMQELLFLNLVIYHFEIETGVIHCPDCERWYPIVQTIPQMLPDNLRNKETDKKFQSVWKI